jgi:hypothetical protein
MRRLAIASLTLLALAGAAHAEDLDCRNGGFPSEQDQFGLAKVAGQGRLYFLGDSDGCPNDGPACRSKTYVVAGDTLLTGRIHGAYLCAFYPNRFGGTAGWVRRDRLTPVAMTAPPLQAWIGHWADGDNTIDLSRRGKGLKVSGEAYWPSANPSVEERPGGPNIGSLDGLITPQGGRARLADEYPDGCRATLTLVGPFLVASDNGGCGGMNVRFDGIYRRR